jgi:hypothetical protein
MHYRNILYEKINKTTFTFPMLVHFLYKLKYVTIYLISSN